MGPGFQTDIFHNELAGLISEYCQRPAFCLKRIGLHGIARCYCSLGDAWVKLQIPITS